MKTKYIIVGGQYNMKVGCVMSTVTITGELPDGGWEGTSASGKVIKIKTADRLLGKVKSSKSDNSAPVKKEKAKPTKAKEPQIIPSMPLIDAAIRILREAGKPMGCKEIYDQCVSKGLWESSGKTPANTLYSAILREIQRDGGNARFVKVGRGLFAAQ